MTADGLRARTARNTEAASDPASKCVHGAAHEPSLRQAELVPTNNEPSPTQRELEASLARYFDLYESAPVGYLTLDPEGLVRDANQTAAELLGVPRAALTGQPWTSFIFHDDRDVYFEHLAQHAQRGAAPACELRLSRRGSRAFWTRLETCETRRADGEVARRIVMTDITHSKREQAGHAQAKRAAGVGLFAAGVRQEPNNPLTYVLANLQSLTRDLPKLKSAVAQCRAALPAVGDEAFAAGVAEDADLPEPESHRISARSK